MRYAKHIAPKLEDAAKALERAAKAMRSADRVGFSDCKHQMAAGWAEVECALALIKDAKGE